MTIKYCAVCLKLGKQVLARFIQNHPFCEEHWKAYNNLPRKKPKDKQKHI